MAILNLSRLLTLLGAALLCGGAFATEPPPRAGAVRATPRADPPAPQSNAATDPQLMTHSSNADVGTPAKVKQHRPGARRKAAKPAHRAAPAKKPARRRAVAAQLDDGLQPPAYRPRLGMVAPMPALPAAPGDPGPGPVILNGCPSGACTDQSGARYNPVGSALISPQGRLCSNNGIGLSCY